MTNNLEIKFSRSSDIYSITHKFNNKILFTEVYEKNKKLARTVLHTAYFKAKCKYCSRGNGASAI
jgi:hypothetical protein